MKPQHTPTPWHTASDESGYFRYVEKDDRIVALLKSTDSLKAEADAAYIVSAVNAHEELMGALYECQGYFEHQSQDQFVSAMLKTITIAIAKAEGR